jgi:hypothetical protein
VYKKRNTGLKMMKTGTVIKLADESDTDDEKNVALNVIKDIVLDHAEEESSDTESSSSSSSSDSDNQPQTVD